jgi:CHAT domain-containing protein/tetratricopeptide (TPR) repeat protein
VSINNLAAVLGSQGGYTEAEPLYREALQLNREVLGPRHPQTLASIINLAAVLGSQGRYTEAEPLYREALQLHREILGPRNPNTLIGMNNLASVLESQGRYREAEPLYRETLQLSREVFGPRDPHTLTSMNNLAGMLHDQGRYGEAEPLYRVALQLHREILGPRNPNTLSTMNNLAGVLDSLGRYGEAEPLWRETLQLRREVLGPRHPDTLTSMNNLAGVLDSQGRYGEEEPLSRETLQLRREVLGPRHPDTLTSMNNLASVLDSQGRYDEAESLYRETLQLRREVLGPRHPNTLHSMDNLAGVLDNQRRYEEAEPLLRETLQLNREVLGPRHPATLTVMNNLAFHLGRQGRYGEAEPLYRDAVQLHREVLGPRHPDTLTALNNLAYALGRQGRYGEAEPLYREALDASEEVLGAVHPTTLLIQQNTVENLAAQGRLTDAVALQRQMEPQVLNWLGVELYSTEPVSVRRHLVASQSTYQSVALSLALLPGAGADAAEMAASALLRFKGLAVDEEVYLARLTRSGEDPRVRAVANEIAGLHNQLARLFEAGDAGRSQLVQLFQPGDVAKEVAAQIKALSAELDAQELELGRISRDYATHLQVRNASLQDLRATLPPRSALLELRLYRPKDFKSSTLSASHWAGVIIGADGTLQVRDLGTVADTSRHIAAMLAKAPSTEGSAKALYQQLLAPFEQQLLGLQRLYVAPDGTLNLLSFALLRDATGRPLLDRLDVRHLQSGRDLLRPPSDKPANGLVAVGGIDFDAVAPAAKVATITTSPADDARLPMLRATTAETFRGGFGRLSHSKDEAEEIGKLYRLARRNETVSVVEDAEPTKSWLLGIPPPRVLHMATHGFYREAKEPTERPMLLSGVALAGANRSLQQGGQDGILYALEAQDLNLEGTELVVLSACETALGKIDYGDGVSGLVRAFRTAGARNVMVTLRPVDDEGAAQFMQRFYFHWLRQTRSDPAAALRQAQREQIDDATTDSTWTGFLLVGG